VALTEQSLVRHPQKIKWEKGGSLRKGACTRRGIHFKGGETEGHLARGEEKSEAKKRGMAHK